MYTETIKGTNMKKLNLTYPQILVGATAVGLVSAFLAAYERVNMLVNPGKELACSLNPVVDCGGVLAASESAVFGPPNMFFGMVVFSVLLAFGLQLLTGGTWTKTVQKVALGLSLFMFAFSAWFFWVSLYVLGKICLFCLAVWPATVFTTVYTTKYYLEQQKKLSGWPKKLRDYLKTNHAYTVFLIFAVMIALFLIQFRDYYFG